ncbi:MAG TPA: hypothetical protein VF116_13075, partial [Ktedonobacterales bacterium]
PLSGSDRSESATESDMPGLPGYVVPGVSDMGLEGPAAVTIGGITTMEPEIELGPEPSPTEEQLQAELDAQGLAGTPATELPEAGDADPASIYEEMARQGTNPPLEPAGNIASVGAAAEELEAARQAGTGERERDDELSGPGLVEGLVHNVETPGPEQKPERRPREPRATRPLAEEPPTPSSAAPNGERPDIEEQPTAPRRRVQPEGTQTSTRAAPRTTQAHVQARGGTAAGKSGAAGTSRGGTTKSASNSGTTSASSRAKGNARGARGSNETKNSKGTGKGKRGSAH